MYPISFLDPIVLGFCRQEEIARQRLVFESRWVEEVCAMRDFVCIVFVGVGGIFFLVQIMRSK